MFISVPRVQPSIFRHLLTDCAASRLFRSIRSSPASASIWLAMATTAISPAQRKNILKVLFISLLLDLVCQLSVPEKTVADHHRYLLLSFFLYSRSSSNSTAISKHLPGVQTPSSIASYLVSMRTRTLSLAPSTIVTTSFSWGAHSDPFSPSSKPSHLLSSAPSPINMGVGQLCYGQWLAI